MPDLKSTFHETLAYFMTEYATDSPPSKLEDCIRHYLAGQYTIVVIAEFLERYFEKIRDQLVEEFNDRYDKKHTLRYKILDEVGNEIAGIGDDSQPEKIQFQDALNSLSPSEFEALSAYVLQICGCESSWKTPESHDQGIDAFGYMPFLRKATGEWIGAKPRIAFLAQAKHYKKTVVGSKDIREFVGSYDMALHKIYSTVDIRYQDLELLPFAPTALVFMTTEEVPRTVKRLSIRSGIVVLSSDDLFDLLFRPWRSQLKTINKNRILKTMRRAIKDIPSAK